MHLEVLLEAGPSSLAHRPASLIGRLRSFRRMNRLPTRRGKAAPRSDQQASLPGPCRGAVHSAPIPPQSHRPCRMRVRLARGPRTTDGNEPGRASASRSERLSRCCEAWKWLAVEGWVGIDRGWSCNVRAGCCVLAPNHLNVRRHAPRKALRFVIQGSARPTKIKKGETTSGIDTRRRESGAPGAASFADFPRR